MKKFIKKAFKNSSNTNQAYSADLIYDDNFLPLEVRGIISSYKEYKPGTELDDVKYNISIAKERQDHYIYYNPEASKDLAHKNLYKWQIVAKKTEDNDYSFFKLSLYIKDDAPLYCLLFLASQYYPKDTQTQHELYKQANWSDISVRFEDQYHPNIVSEDDMLWPELDISSFNQPIKDLSHVDDWISESSDEENDDAITYSLPQAIKATCRLGEEENKSITIEIWRSINL